jgi:hypothetical protein
MIQNSIYRVFQAEPEELAPFLARPFNLIQVLT